MHSITGVAVVVLLLTGSSIAQAPPQTNETDPLRVKHRFAAQDVEIERKLRQPVALVDFDEAPLDQVLAWLQATANVNMHVRWLNLEDIGVEHNHPISVHLTELPLDRILRVVLDVAGGADIPMAFDTRDGVLLISTMEDFFSTMVARVYPVRDLLETRVAQLRRLLSDERSAEARPSARPTLVQSADAAFRERQGERSEPDPKPKPADPQLEAECLEHAGGELIDLLRTSIAPDSWVINAGPGTIIRYNSTLVIRAPNLVHKEIADLFAQMRANGAADTP